MPAITSSTPLSKMSVRAVGAVVGAAAASAGHMEETKVEVMVIILLVSLLAVSFPTISKQVPFLHIPGILFFIGKHFGTGVILATAFIHLLDDAFRSLQDGRVKERYGNVSKWTGSIILVSLLAIFLVEYISTTYVEHLQQKSSAPPTPVPSRPISPTPSRRIQQSTVQTSDPLSETTPLLSVKLSQPPVVPVLPVPTRTQTYPLAAAPVPVPHFLHPQQNSLLHVHAPPIPALPIDVLANSPRVCRMAMARDHVHLQKKYGAVGEQGDEMCGGESELELGHEHRHGHGHDHEHENEQLSEGKPRVGRRRQVVGLLVLQLGIMIHSFVIGLTLAVTSGADFTSLTTAVVFHQLFEGLSLGIRIAGLPPAPKSNPKFEIEDECDEYQDEECAHEHSAAGAAYPCGSTIPGTVIPAPSSKATPSLSSSLRRTRASGERWKGVKSRLLKQWERIRRVCAEVQWLKPVLTVLFGITTPTGMGVGMVLWKGKGHGGEDAPMLLVQGIMSAVSAGLLIYAATVEMIAGDFVFGDVEGHHHHHHHHHQHDHRHEHESGGADAGHDEGASVETETDVEEAELGGGLEELEAELEGEEEGEGGGKTAPLRKRALAVFSLFAGAGMMVLVGLGE